MTTDLKTAFDKENLLRCWTWLNTNADNNYKNHFRSLYKAYALSLDENIDKLHRDLKYHRYKPELSTKLYIPKKSGILRPYTLLNINDQIVYLALVSIIAEKLFKKAKKNYNKSVFGHLYAGKTSLYFYQKWSDGYVNFNHSINDAFTSGYKWTASFDLTAFYDSIDHKVLTHFLSGIGITKEFSKYLTDCLEVWTASTPTRIYHGHGIPQGPLPSGLLSEVILQYFDEHKSFKKTTVRYFRYVDDIRLLAKTEGNVRKGLLELDYTSKEIGLFPQSGKINIHEIENLDDEIKTISLPPEPINFRLAFDQTEVLNRFNELVKANKVLNETRFKYVLAHAAPNEKLAKKLLNILLKNPHLYQSILKHFSKYKKFTKSVSTKILSLLKLEQLYEEVTTAYILTSLNKIHKDLVADFKTHILSLHSKRKTITSPNLRSIIFVWLLNENHFTYKEIENIYKSTEWWLIHNSLDYIDIDRFGEPSYQAILNVLIKSSSFEVAIKAAYLISEHNLKVTTPLSKINDSAQIILKKAGIIGKTSLSKSSIPARLNEIAGITFPTKNWKTFLNTDHSNCERLALLLTGHIKTDANSFINEFDVFNDFVCKALFLHDGTLGTYTLGKIGSTLHSTTSRFATNYPKFNALCKKVHELRLESDLSHPIVKSTGKATRRIKFSEIKKLMKIIIDGYTELISSI
ncbi:MAG: hypothetical protein J0M08_14265 [Bacteroidetes bacterium]|nr:hypothetical protein [Bacteroidota bacterium]